MEQDEGLSSLTSTHYLAWRWGAFVVLAVFGVLGYYYAAWDLNSLATLVGVSAAGAALVTWIARAGTPGVSASRLRLVIYLRLFLDLGIVLVAIHLTGGITSPILFIVPMFLVVIDLQSGPHLSMPASFAALACIAVIGFVELEGWLPHMPMLGLLPENNLYYSPLFVLAVLVCLLGATYLGLANSRNLAAKLRSREASLAQSQAQLSRRVQELDAQREIGQQLVASLQLDIVLDAIGENARRLVNANDVHLFLYDEPSGKFGRGVGVWADGQHRLAVSAPREHGLSASVVRARRPILIDNVEHHPLFSSPDARAWKMKSIAGFPIKKGERVLGVLNAAFVVPHHFTEDERDALVALATQAALAIDNASLYSQLEQRARELAALYRVNLSVTQSLDPKRLMDEALAAVQEVMQVSSGIIMLVDAGSGDLALRAQRGLAPTAYEQFRSQNMKNGDADAARVLATGEPLLTQVSQRDLESHSAGQAGEGTHTLAIIPLQAQNRVLGVLRVTRGDDAGFSAADVGLLTAIAQQIAIALENARLYSEAKRRMEELTSLREIGLAMTSTLQLREQLRSLHVQVQKLIRPDSFFVGLYDDVRREINVQFVVEEGWELRGPIVPLDAAGLSSWVVRTRRPLCVGDLDEERARLPVAPRHETRPARSWLGVPLLLRDRLIGILSVQSFRPHAFSAADEHFLTAVAQHAAMAIENARLYETTERRARELRLVNEISRAISASLDLGDIFRKTVRGLADVFGYQFLSIYLIQGDQFWLQAQIGYDRPVSLCPLDQGAIGRAARTGQVAFVRNADADSDMIPGAPGVAVEIAVPLRNEKQIIGVLDVQDRRADALGEDDVEVLATFGEQIGIAVRNAELYQSVLERERFASSLRRVALALTSTLDSSKILDTLCQESLEFFRVQGAYVWAVEGQELVGIAARGENRQQFLNLRLPVDEPNALSAQVVRLRRPMYLNEAANAASNHPWLQGLFQPRSLIGVPLIIENQPVGALILTDQHNPTRFGPADLERVTLLASQAAVALANARLYAQARSGP